MFHHIITFHSPRDFGQFTCEIGSWWEELATCLGGQLDTEFHYHAVYRSATPIEKEHQIDIQAAPYTVKSLFNLNENDIPPAETHTQEEEVDESSVALESQLGRDVARLVEQYFPGVGVLSIHTEYHEGVFIGDYSINLDVKLDHPRIQHVGISFSNEDVFGRPSSWQKLVSTPDILLFLDSITIENSILLQNCATEKKSVTLTTPKMYQEEIERWCSTHHGGSLYSHVETPEMFIIATELMSHSHEEIKRAAEQLVERANAKGGLPVVEDLHGGNQNPDHPF